MRNLVGIKLSSLNTKNSKFNQTYTVEKIIKYKNIINIYE